MPSRRTARRSANRDPGRSWTADTHEEREAPRSRGGRGEKRRDGDAGLSLTGLDAHGSARCTRARARFIEFFMYCGRQRRTFTRLSGCRGWDGWMDGRENLGEHRVKLGSWDSRRVLTDAARPLGEGTSRSSAHALLKYSYEVNLEYGRSYRAPGRRPIRPQRERASGPRRRGRYMRQERISVEIPDSIECATSEPGSAGRSQLIVVLIIAINDGSEDLHWIRRSTVKLIDA
ncbi:hypothetical protein DFH09DRAFT_1467454 [Mycena vulgaris]|nr:hypothetical protein DFH09DRAFT_1467454 [Mycena vulgaris]